MKLFATDKLLRATADLLMLNFSFFLAELIVKAVLQPVGGFKHLFAAMPEHLYGILVINIMALIVFYLHGFYTRSRAYQSRYKALVVLQAVCSTYVIFGFLNYLHHSDFVSPPVLIVSWIICLGLMLAARLWSVIWRKVILQEAGNPSLHIKPVNAKEVLVIGGAGYIGSALIPLLLAEGYSLRVMDAFVYGSDSIKDYLNHPKVKIIRADFRQIDKIVEAVKGVSAVVHLGALVGDPACALDENLTIEINLMATRMIAEVCKGFGVEKFVFASTCSVYGASDDVLDEYSKLNPISLYARSKIACEKILLELADDNFSPVILRFSTIFGFSGRTRFDLVVNLLTAKACFDKQITVMGGDQWRPFLHVEDAARSVVCALKTDKEIVHKEVYNVGADHLNYTLLQVGEIIAVKVPSAELLSLDTNQDRRNYRVSFTKINKDLKFIPKWSLEEGIDQVIRAIENGQVQNYQHAQYSNVKFLVEHGMKEQLSSQSILKFEAILSES